MILRPPIPQRPATPFPYTPLFPSLLVANATQGFFQSITAATTLVQTLIASLLARGGDQAVQELEANEAHLGALGAYWDDNEQGRRSEEHTSELQSLMRSSYAVFCLKKKKQNK